MKTIGVYIHIPFCKRKCPYCDFYSVSHSASAGDDRILDDYTELLCQRLKEDGERLSCQADTLYFGGGTPSLLGAERLCRILRQAKESFGLSDAEITLEVNPEKRDLDFDRLRQEGFNRISIGLQSANDNELQALGRLHSVSDAEFCITRARQAGFENLSLDLMIAVPRQTRESLLHSIHFCALQEVTHISAYLLKIEPGTPFDRMKDRLLLCDDDEQAERYLLTVETLQRLGYQQYEISNFARPGFEGRHNLHYWHDEEYLGYGPSAHSFLNGQRFFYDRSMESYRRDIRISDGTGGDEEEYLLLALRLREGVTEERFFRRFGYPIPRRYYQRAIPFQKAGYLSSDSHGIRLTPKGFLVSNTIISSLLTP